MNFNKNVSLNTKVCIDSETGIRMGSCGKRCVHNQGKPKSKYNWHEPTPLFDGNYKDVIEWYKFWQKCEFELRNARLLNDIPKIFIYEQIVPLVKSDGIR